MVLGTRQRQVMALIFDESMQRLALVSARGKGGREEAYPGILGRLAIGESTIEAITRLVEDATRLHVPHHRWTMLGSVGSKRFRGARHRVDIFYTQVEYAALSKLARAERVSLHLTAQYRAPCNRNLPLASVVLAAVASRAALEG